MATRTTEPKAPASTRVEAQLGLHVVEPRGLVNAPLRLAELSILGRDMDGVNCIPHGTISRRHAEVRRLPSGYALADLGSTNGTFVNGQSARDPILLLPNMVVRLGDVLAVVAPTGAVDFLAMPELPGTAEEIRELRARLRIAAADLAPVLITGETGTGKEQLAAAIHRHSGRRGSFVALNCAELSSQLIEAQLFGYERGAFTGAAASKPGLFAEANGGTLFLDELAELPLDLQAKLLRVLESGEVRPVGSVRSQQVDVRVVAATNKQLGVAVERGEMRRDLHARLAFWELHLPPLRHRRQDIFLWIRLLTQAWIASRSASAQGHHACRELCFTPDAAQAIVSHAWPDNLRGLNHLVHRLAAVAGPSVIGKSLLRDFAPELVEHLSAASTTADSGIRSTSVPATVSSRSPKSRPTKHELEQVYLGSNRSVRATAKHFGKDRRQIYRWLDSYGIAR